MPLLYYWQPDNYRRDLDMGAGYHLNQGSPLLHSLELGDSLWAFTRLKDGRYAIAAELVIRAKTINPPGFRYGRHRVWGDLRSSRYFRTAGQPNAEPLLREVSGRQATILAQSFQGHQAVRPLSIAAGLQLGEWVKSFPMEPRARLWSEERLEAELLLGDPVGVRRLLVEEAPGIAAARRQYLFQQATTRNPAHVRKLQAMYHGRCQLCAWDPNSIYGEALCEVHHIVWLSRGGDDVLSNLVLICPSHHRAIHGCDAPLDWSDFCFDFGAGRRELVTLNLHLPT